MQPSHEVEVLPFPIPWRPWKNDFPCINARVPSGWIDREFGPPSIEDEAGDGVGPQGLWRLRFPCGFESVMVVYRWSPMSDPPDAKTQLVDLVLPSPEIEHVLRHLNFPPQYLTWRYDQSELVAAERERLFKDEHSWEVWRQDDNGNAFLMQYAASERDAKCLADTFERRGHKQMYWVAPRKTEIPG